MATAQLSLELAAQHHQAHLSFHPPVVVTAEGRVIKFGHGLVTQLDHTDNLRRDKVYPLSPHAKGFEGEGRRLGGDVAEHDKGSDDWDQGPDVRYDPQANFDFTSLQERLAAMDNMSVF